jgi:hypothetical protein
VAAASIVDTGGADSNGLVTIPATGDRATLAPNFFALATQITDGVGVVPGDVDADGFVTDDAVALTDPSNTDLPNEQPAILYTSVTMTEAATPAGGGVPALTELTTEVGEVAGAGTGAGLVAHSGIGAGAPALAQVSKYSIVTGVDFNEDGYDDMAVLTAAGNIDILYGRTGMNTNYAAAGAGDSWPAVAANVGEAVGGAGILVNGVAIAAGDVNGDGHADLVALENGATAGVRIILGQGPTAATPFANQATRERLYPASAAADLTGGAVLIGDVGGGPAGIDDIVIGAPNFNNGGVGDGAIFVIYGSGSLPADASILDTQAAFTPYGTSVVGVGAGADARGQVIYVGDYDGAGLLDVVAGYGNLGLNTDSIEVFPGAMPFPPAPTVTYQVGLAASLVNGSFWLADVDGTAGTDIIVGAPGALAGVGLLSIIPNGTAASTAINSASTIDYTGGVGDALGTALSVIEDGDGNTYVLVGATGGDYVDVISAPITGDFTVSGVDQRLNVAGGGTAGDSIHWNDVNADGNPDLIVGDSGAGTAYCMFGLD